MTIRNLDQLLAPKSVALIGASRKEGSVGLITARNLLRGGFAGPVWLVNPKYRDIEGHPCHPSIAALPGVPQLAVVATPPHTVPGAVPVARSGVRVTALTSRTAGGRAPCRASP
jgi:acetyltransferase